MLNEIYDDYYLENGKIEFDVTKLKKMKVAELRELCYLHNVDSTGVKALLITKLESFAAGNYVNVQKPEPKPEMPLDEIILKMQEEMETHDMSISERDTHNCLDVLRQSVYSLPASNWQGLYKTKTIDQHPEIGCCLPETLYTGRYHFAQVHRGTHSWCC